MYDMLLTKVDRLEGKIHLVPKKILSREFFMYISNILSWGFGSRVKIAACQVLLHGLTYFFLCWSKGQFWAAVTRPCRLSTPLCHTYSELGGHEDSPSSIYNIPYLFKKKLSKSLLSNPFLGYYWWFLSQEPDLHSEFSDFQNLSVLSNFLAWNHVVCHKYR